MPRVNEKTVRSALLLFNIIVCFILTGLAAYRQGFTNGESLWDLAWAAPLIYILGVLAFRPYIFCSFRHTVINIGLIILSGIFCSSRQSLAHFTLDGGIHSLWVSSYTGFLRLTLCKPIMKN